MENENNKWEYDYSNLYGTSGSSAGSAGGTGSGTAAGGSAQDTGYVNVGSSGTNAANRYNTQDGTTSQPSGGAGWSSSAGSTAGGTGWSGGPTYQAGGATGYGGGYYGGSAQPEKQKKQRKPIPWGKVGKSVLSLALVFAVGFGGGWLGAALNNSGNRVVVQTVERNEAAALSTTSSTGGSDLTLAQVSAMVSPSVVVITTEAMVSTGSWFGVGQVQSGAGSGVIMSADGYILTCAHVISGASNIIVTIDDVDYTAVLIGEDAESDIAVIKIEATGLVPAVMADSDTLVVGEEVVAVGNPLGELGGTVTNGIVSALNRNVVVEDTEMSLIQTNASVSPGNSGGGLFNMAGELIGIVNAKSADEDAEGLGFAIPVNTALAVAQDLLENGYVSGRPALGVTVLEISDAETAAYYGVSAYGVYIADVTKGGGADKAGLQVGDRIVAINGTEVTTTSDLTGVIGDCAVGDVVSLSIARSGQLMTVEVTLHDRNAGTTAATPSAESDAQSGAAQDGEGQQGTLPGQSGQSGDSQQGGQTPGFPGFGGNGRG